MVTNTCEAKKNYLVILVMSIWQDTMLLSSYSSGGKLLFLCTHKRGRYASARGRNVLQPDCMRTFRPKISKANLLICVSGRRELYEGHRPFLKCTCFSILWSIHFWSFHLLVLTNIEPFQGVVKVQQRRFCGLNFPWKYLTTRAIL